MPCAYPQTICHTQTLRIDNIDAFFTAPYDEYSDVSVEAGFWDEYSSLSGGVKEALASAATVHGTHDVIVTGHSSGGSCATLLAFDIARGATDLTGFGVKSVITFGSPRVGNAEFVSTHAGFGLYSVRVTHYHDIVPHVPEEFMGYRHVVSEVWYAEDYEAGSYTICNDRWGCLQSTHHLHQNSTSLSAAISRQAANTRPNVTTPPCSSAPNPPTQPGRRGRLVLQLVLALQLHLH